MALQKTKQNMAQRVLGGIGTGIGNVANTAGQDLGVLGGVMKDSLKNAYGRKMKAPQKPTTQNVTDIPGYFKNQQQQVNNINQLSR